MRGRPTKDPYTRPPINTLERLHAELDRQILENKVEAPGRCFTSKPSLRCWTRHSTSGG
jgi:hypothetical protein